MNTPAPTRLIRRHASRHSGFALVIVLAVLVLIVALVVTFLTRATTERSASASYSASISARQLGDTAVSLVQAQINQAASKGVTVAWVSQPGMVRTYDQQGSLLKAYKLYSAPDMISGSVGITSGNSPDSPPTSWASDVALWTDLNAPVQLPDGKKLFPILDPSAAAEGYSNTSAPGATSYQPVPMPVRWLYILQDGSLVSPTGSGKTVTVAGATPGNPIVGRIAFWTDDETCKVNVNTASAGTFWDVPRAYSVLSGTTGLPIAGDLTKEQGLGYFQPIQHEFQRYPAHPAMTDLRAVFGSANITEQQIYDLVPRIVGGGSTQGTVHVAGSTAGLSTDSDRLYASVDELIFDPDRTANSGLTKSQLEQGRFFLSTHSRAPETNLFNLPRVACWPVHASLASDAASPYTTAFDRLIAFCASTGSGANIKPYYFQRQSALSATDDIALDRNKELYAYLQRLSSLSIPGFGGNFATKYGGDRDQILTEIFDYIRSTNLYDSTLSTGMQFTSQARGCVVPSVNTASSATTMGFGRYNTISELAIGFICNADGNDPVVQDGSLGRLSSNVPEANPSAAFDIKNKGANRVLGGTALNPGEKYVQAILVPEFFSVMYGFISMMPKMQVSISGLSKLSLNGQQLFPSSADGTITYHDLYPDGASLSTAANYSTAVASKYGGNPGWRYFALGVRSTTNAGAARRVPARGSLPADSNTIDEEYPFVSLPVKITSGATMSFSGGNVVVTLSDPDGKVIQTLNIRFPSTTLPVPQLVTTGTIGRDNGGPAGIATTTAEAWWGFNKNGVISDGYNPPKGAYSSTSGGRLNNISFQPTDRAATPTIYAGVFFRSGFDVIRSVFPLHGDFRLVAGQHEVADTVFQPHPDYDSSSVMCASTLTNMASTRYDPGIFDTRGAYSSTVAFPSGREPDIAYGVTASDTPSSTGDYDDPLPDVFPGPFINKSNEGCVSKTGSPKSIPYYSSVTLTTANGADIVDQPDGGTFFSPNRIMPSPGMFGSLPSGVVANKPWQTLLFRPQTGHPGAASPPDHLWLDLFWMPVVEPYAISDRFSTAGKINLNYQILPFTYLKRSTGLWALFDSERVTAMPNSQVSVYKSTSGTGVALRKKIDATETLKQFQAKFDAGDVFKTASEICSVHIVPTGSTASTMPSFWTSNALTGDNVRELIYTNLYPRLTTKSNTYTVHFVAQSLKKNPGSAATVWTEGSDIVTSEYRGATTIERFIDANNADIPDYASHPASIPGLDALDKFYRWRVISNRQFAP